MVPLELFNEKMLSPDAFFVHEPTWTTLWSSP